MVAFQICQFFISKGMLIYKPLKNIHLQKLIYISQGVHLSVLGKPLFEDEIIASSDGPMIPLIYKSFKCYGNNPIDHYEFLKISQNLISNKQAIDVLNIVWNFFGYWDDNQLMNFTNKANGPWYTTYHSNKNGIIPNKLIMDYFKKEVVVFENPNE